MFSLNNDKGWTEVIIDTNCDVDKFYMLADILKKEFQIEIISQINDFDTYYWDFMYHGSRLTLYYNIYMGLSIFPSAFKKATIVDNGNAVEMGELLFKKLV